MKENLSEQNKKNKNTVKPFKSDEVYEYLETVYRLKKALDFKREHPALFENKAKIKKEYTKIFQSVKENFERFLLYVLTDSNSIKMNQNTYQWLIENNKHTIGRAYELALQGEGIEVINTLQPIVKLNRIISMQ